MEYFLKEAHQSQYWMTSTQTLPVAERASLSKVQTKMFVPSSVLCNVPLCGSYVLVMLSMKIK